jgi:hypothetical protein
MNGAYIQGIYKSTIHLSFMDTIITIGDKIGRGKHHILIDKAIDFSLLNLIPLSRVEMINRTLKIGSLSLDVLDGSVLSFYPYQKTYHITVEIIEVIEKLKNMITTEHHSNLFSYDKNDPWMSYQIKQIKQFLDQPSLINAHKILGLGIGLTPLGDDILTGYILGLNTVGKSVDWFTDLIVDSKLKTNRLSSQNLQDTFGRYYPDIFIQMIESIFIEHHIDQAKSILNLGATSGAGILIGFIYGLI